MQKFSDKLNAIAGDTNACLKKFFSKKNKYSYLIKPMKYGVFSGVRGLDQPLLLIQVKSLI